MVQAPALGLLRHQPQWGPVRAGRVSAYCTLALTPSLDADYYDYYNSTLSTMHARASASGCDTCECRRGTACASAPPLWHARTHAAAASARCVCMYTTPHDCDTQARLRGDGDATSFTQLTHRAPWLPNWHTLYAVRSSDDLAAHNFKTGLVLRHRTIIHYQYYRGNRIFR